MKFHGNVELQNLAEVLDLNVEEVATLPTWTAGDESRVLYDQTTDKLYYGNASEWVEIGDALTFSSQFDVSSNNVSLDASIEDLNDVSGTTSVDSGTVIAKGASGFVAQKLYHQYSSSSASTSHVITHNLGQRFVMSNVVDDSHNVILPSNIELTDENTTTITFNTAINCHAIIMGIATPPPPWPYYSGQSTTANTFYDQDNFTGLTNIAGIAYDGTTWFGTNGEGGIYSSTDLVSWSLVGDIGSGGAYHSICWLGGDDLAVASSNFSVSQGSRIRIVNKNTGSITSSLSSLTNDPIKGVAFDGDNLYVALYGYTDIQVRDGISDTILSTETGPTTSMNSMFHDGTNLIVSSDSDIIHVLNGTTYAVEDSFSTPSSNPGGLTYDGTNLVSTGTGTGAEAGVYVHDGISAFVP